MNINHRREAEKHASQGAFTDSKIHPIDPIATDFHFRLAQIHATLAAGEPDSLRPLLAALITRWEEVADSYKPKAGDRADLTDRYREQRRAYLRVIDDLTTALVHGRLSYALMTDAEAAEHGIVRDGV